MIEERKRPNGRGTIETLRDGVRKRIRAVVEGKRRQVGPIYPDQESAERALAAWNYERDEGAIEAPTGSTVAVFGHAWIDRREVSGSRKRAVIRSVAGERSIWSTHVAQSELGAMALASVTTADVEDFAVWLRGRRAVQAITTGFGSERSVERRPTSRPLSRSMQSHALRLVRGCFDEALRRGVIDRNPAAGVSVALGGPRARDLSEDWLREGEIGALLSCEAIPQRDRTAFAAALGLAVRLGDLKRIELAHVQLGDAAPGPHVRVWVSKSEKWHRVPILPWLRPWLVRHVATLPKGARFLFPNREGGRYGASFDFGWSGKRERVHVGRGAKRRIELVITPGALELAGVARRIRFHDLRGTTATHLALGTWGRVWTLQEVQAMLAHSDQRVTERYVRRAVDMLAAAALATPGCPRLPTAPSSAIDGSALFAEALPPGFEPGTFRLGSADAREGSREVAGDVGNAWATAPIEALARAVVLAVAEGDPHAMRRALELAERVLADAGVEVEPKGARRPGG